MKYKGSNLHLTDEDITQMNVDVIVNAANSRLAGGGGVDGAIHRAAGPGLHEACMALNGCPTGSAKITPGFRLPAKHIIHAVGPVWRDGQQGEAGLLEGCYIKSLELAMEHGCSSIAFPNISTGIYGYPKHDAAKVAVGAVYEFLDTHDVSLDVYFVCFDRENYRIYNEMLNPSST